MEWIYLDIVDEDILPIAEKLINKDLLDSGYEIKKNPHITVVPKFDSTENIELPELMPQQRFDISGFRFWPDFEDPMVVMLDISNYMVVQLWRDEILTQIGQESLEQELVPPHITLFKAGNKGDEYNFKLDSEIRNDLIDDCDSIDLPDSVRANGIKIENWKSEL
jgi:2'-5' RNA ligase